MFLREMLADFLAKDRNQPRSTASADEKGVEKEQPPLATRHHVSPGLLLWALAVLPLNLAAFWVPTAIWGEEREKVVGPTPFSHWAVALFAVFPACASLVVFVFAWIIPRRTTLADAEHSHAQMRGGMLDAVLIPPFYAIWVAYQFPEHCCTVMAGSVMYVGQGVGWMRFFWRSRRETLERAATAVACGSAPV